MNLLACCKNTTEAARCNKRERWEEEEYCSTRFQLPSDIPITVIPCRHIPTRKFWGSSVGSSHGEPTQSKGSALILWNPQWCISSWLLWRRQGECTENHRTNRAGNGSPSPTFNPNSGSRPSVPSLVWLPANSSCVTVTCEGFFLILLLLLRGTPSAIKKHKNHFKLRWQDPRDRFLFSSHTFSLQQNIVGSVNTSCLKSCWVKPHI